VVYGGNLKLTHENGVIRGQKFLRHNSAFVCLALQKLNSMVWVRERTIPTERPPLVGEVIANFCG
jgi:hypothetical protein